MNEERLRAALDENALVTLANDMADTALTTVRASGTARPDLESFFADMLRAALAADPEPPAGLDVPWKSIALSLRGNLRGIAEDRTITTLDNARACARRAVANADARLAGADPEEKP